MQGDNIVVTAKFFHVGHLSMHPSGCLQNVPHFFLIHKFQSNLELKEHEVKF